MSQEFDVLMNSDDGKQKATKMKADDCTKGERKQMHILRLELGTIKEFTYPLHHLSDNFCIFIVLEALQDIFEHRKKIDDGGQMRP